MKKFLFLYFLFFPYSLQSQNALKIIFDYGTIEGIFPGQGPAEILSGRLHNRMQQIQLLKEKYPDSILLHLGNNFNQKRWTTTWDNGKVVGQILSFFPYDAIRFSSEDLSLNAKKIKNIHKDFILPFLNSSPKFLKKHSWLNPFIRVVRQPLKILLFADMQRVPDPFLWHSLEVNTDINWAKFMHESQTAIKSTFKIMLCSPKNWQKYLENRNIRGDILLFIARGDHFNGRRDRGALFIKVPENIYRIPILTLNLLNGRIIDFKTNEIRFTRSSTQHKKVARVLKDAERKLKMQQSKFLANAKTKIEAINFRMITTFLKSSFNCDLLIIPKKNIPHRIPVEHVFLPWFYSYFKSNPRMFLFNIAAEDLLDRLRLITIFKPGHINLIAFCGFKIINPAAIISHIKDRALEFKEKKNLRILISENLLSDLRLKKSRSIYMLDGFLIDIVFKACLEYFDNKEIIAEK
ncbi:hypothetical protein ACFL35_16465 [Candidatus Riflebacteria bacterium]